MAKHEEVFTQVCIETYTLAELEKEGRRMHADVIDCMTYRLTAKAWYECIKAAYAAKLAEGVKS